MTIIKLKIFGSRSQGYAIVFCDLVLCCFAFCCIEFGDSLACGSNMVEDIEEDLWVKS